MSGKKTDNATEKGATPHIFSPGTADGWDCLLGEAGKGLKWTGGRAVGRGWYRNAVGVFKSLAKQKEA